MGVERVLAGRYRLRRLIAKGGMAEVWEAVDDILGRPVAVKVLHSHLADDESFRERFRREAIAAARLAHPNVVATFDTGTDEGITFIVMELVEGATLRQILNETGPMAPARIVHVGAQVADALHYAHRAGVVHRDVKPANILVCPDGRVKVADFGIAKAVEESEPDRPSPSEALTGTGSIIGTAQYLAPEQVDGRAVDGRTDVYALGVVLYEMVCGRPPFTGETDMAVALKHITTNPVAPGAVRAGVPRALEEIVLRAMAKAPEHRYQSADELRLALLSIDLRAGEATAVVLGAAPAPAGDRPGRPHPAARRAAQLRQAGAPVGGAGAGHRRRRRDLGRGRRPLPAVGHREAPDRRDRQPPSSPRSSPSPRRCPSTPRPAAVSSTTTSSRSWSTATSRRCGGRRTTTTTASGGSSPVSGSCCNSTPPTSSRSSR